MSTSSKGLGAIIITVISLTFLSLSLGDTYLSNDITKFEESLAPEEKAGLEEIMVSFVTMPRGSLVEYKENDQPAILALVCQKNGKNVSLNFSATRDGMTAIRSVENLYDARCISRIILPSDPDYKDKLAEFVQQE